MTGKNTKSFLYRAIRIAAWFVAALVGLIVLLVIALQFHSVQRFIAQKVVASIAEKTHTRIEIGSVEIAFSHSVVLHDVFVEDQKHDTLLAAQTVAVDVNLLGILSNSINVSNIRIDTLTAHITRTLPDSSFNFDFILAALASDSTSSSKPDTSTSGWRINLGGLNLNGIHATYIDEVSGMNMSVQLGTMDVSMDKFDLDKMRFHAGKVSLENTTANITQTKESPPDTSASPNLDLGFGTITLANLHLTYENKITNERYAAELGASELVADKIDLQSHAVALKRFHLANTNIVVVQPKAAGKQKAKSNSGTAPWVISLDDLNLNNNRAQFDVRGTTNVKGLDPNHLQLDALTLEATNIFFSENKMSADIHHTSFREHSGLELRELSGGFVLDSLHTELSNFTIETPGSRIHQDIVLSYSSISALKNLPGSVHVKATVGDSHVAISDILFFQPSLPIRRKPGSTIRFSSKFSGLVRDLRVEEFKLATGDSTRV
ncbi:MAG: AsmA family protein, partial [bacterium]